MKTVISYASKMSLPVLVTAGFVLAFIFASTGTITLADLRAAFIGGIVVAVVVEFGLGIFMASWASRRHGIIPEGMPMEPIDEFDVFP